MFSGDTGEPIEGAEVVNLFEHTSVRTSKTGTTTLSFLPEGGSMIRIQKLGYYPGGSTIPMQYNRTGSSCGVLLLWTRER